MQYTLSSSEFAVTIDTHGAELTSLRFHDREFLYQKKDSQFWQRQSPVLFPIVGALRDGQYSFQGKNFSLPQHGFARDMDFSLMDQSDSHLTFSLVSSEQTFSRYPFSFILEISYTLEAQKLTVAYSLRNNGKETLFASLGAHPAFALDENIDAYSLFFPEDTALSYERLVDGLLDKTEAFSLSLDKNFLPLSEALFDHDALIFRHLQSRSIFLSRGEEKLFRFDCGDFPCFALWKQKNAPFLCLEPWQGHADPTDFRGEFPEKPGIISLSPQDSRLWKWAIDFSV